MEIYVVRQGDSVDAIATAYGADPETVIFDNQLTWPYELAVGQALLIPHGERRAWRSVRSNGYAYPFISPWVLDETLPYLTELSVFSYGFTAYGELLPPELDDLWMIERAGMFGTLPVLTLTPIGPDGNFNNYLIHSVVQTPEYRNRLIGELLDTVREKGYGGVDIDFEYILAEDRDAFTEFVRATAEALRPEGYQVSVALAPKTSADQPGLLYEGKDYPALGEAADHVLLMTYEWGYAYGPPMAVAPLNMVRRVVEYAVTEIPPEKISLGIPNYGYDWSLPFVHGVTRAQTIGNVEAVRIAIENGVPIQFDETAGSPFFRYERDGIRHEVWFEDVRSLQGKFDLIEEFGLRGPGYWQIMQLFRANWVLLRDRFYIEKG